MNGKNKAWLGNGGDWLILLREQGWHSGESTALPPLWPDSIPRLSVISGPSLLVLYSGPSQEVFLQIVQFSPLPKTSI